MITMRAKMVVSNVETFKDQSGVTVTGERLHFRAVAKNGAYPNDGSDENNSFARWTPNAELTMFVNNPELFGKFAINQQFYVDFSEADSNE